MSRAPHGDSQCMLTAWGPGATPHTHIYKSNPRIYTHGKCNCPSVSCVLCPVLSVYMYIRKRSQCFTYVSKDVGSLLSSKFPTVALQQSKSSASLHGWGCIETLGTCFQYDYTIINILYLSIYIYLSIY